MADFIRLTGPVAATPNIETKDVRFVLATEGHEPVSCVASYGATAQIAGALGSALRLLQMAMEAQTATVAVTVEKLQDADVQKDQWADRVLVRLTNVQGIPYIFELPCEIASEFADRMKIEASKATAAGHG